MSLSICKFFFIFVIFNLSFSIANSYPKVPITSLTFGSICDETDKDFEEYRYPEKIPYCERDVKTSLKRKIYEDYGIPKKCHKRYTIDHFIPLSIGGNNSPENLWPEHVLIKATRPNFEQEIYEAVASGVLSQDEAIDLVITEKTKNDQVMRELAEDECDQ